MYMQRTVMAPWFLDCTSDAESILIHRNCLWGAAFRGREARTKKKKKKLCLVLGVWHFPIFDRRACQWLLHSGQALLPPSLRAPQDGGVSTSLSKILSTTCFLLVWRYPAVHESPSRPFPKQQTYCMRCTMEEVYIWLLRSTIRHYCHKSVNT